MIVLVFHPSFSGYLSAVFWRPLLLLGVFLLFEFRLVYFEEGLVIRICQTSLKIWFVVKIPPNAFRQYLEDPEKVQCEVEILFIYFLPLAYLVLFFK